MVEKKKSGYWLTHFGLILVGILTVIQFKYIERKVHY